jgi:hypothetical protein
MRTPSGVPSDLLDRAVRVLAAEPRPFPEPALERSRNVAAASARK